MNEFQNKPWLQSFIGTGLEKLTRFGKLTSAVAGAFLMFNQPTVACQLALSLALDVSSSVDSKEFKQQADGLAYALQHPDTANAIFTIPNNSIALHIYQWSGARNQFTVLDWTTIDEPGDLIRAGEIVRNMPRSAEEFPTSLGYSLGFGAIALRNSPDCMRKTLDVAGDGRNNHGFKPSHAYRHFPFSNITVNGLAIGGADETITEYYLSEVIRGAGAFVETAKDFEDYGRAMRRKLLREIGDLTLSSLE